MRDPASATTETVRKELEVTKPVGGLVSEIPVDGLALLGRTKDGRISDASHELR